MKKELTVTAKTVEEAVKLAAEQLGAPSVSDIAYTVLEEPRKGLFGIGASPAKISASYEIGGEIIALNFLRRITADMGLEVNINLKDGPADDKLITVDGDPAGILIGHHGETMDALQYLTNLAANRKEDGERDHPYVRITLDVEGYRAKREETLRALARRMAQKVLRYKKSIVLEPMSPYERRIIHSEIQEIQGVSTNSIGVENNRRIVIYLEGSDPGQESRGYEDNRRGTSRGGNRGYRGKASYKSEEEDNVPIFPVEDLY